MPVKGGGRARDFFRGLDDRAVRATRAALFECADHFKASAQVAITRGSVSGKSHVASRPGDPPHNDTGSLKSGIVVRKPKPDGGALISEVRSEARYAAHLEFGTSKMSPRPYMRPTRDATLPAARATLIRRLKKIYGGK